ncbi:MAG: methylenetetrahydrofolate--tRNA-(uracil(54)-C(5))-methyltransferase (FADH(2)-oxidizing) TrmFO [Syntrophus sp. (in: bacteria)]|nr:methylenetetrahydrofolate--tRNA-(uracil(54)-C(5))-methyltransferase (FADH(2)-oxidizing) TrmFO [Syntrophus sp. (in: bacteria)]
MEIKIVGGGLAGSEAAYQIARRGGEVILYEMRPSSCTPAHKTAYLSELVCSNSMKSKELTNAHGLLKEELRLLDSLVIRIAHETAIPGGKALVVDREKFAQRITGEIEDNANIRVVREEVEEVPSGTVIIATGPLTSSKLTEKIGALTGEENLYFFDAISPVIDAESVDMEKAFYASRYAEEKSDDYLNCPLTEEEYKLFYEELISAGRVDFKEFEKTSFFEGCLPIEVMAERGKQTLLYGPMKPVGLIDEHTGKRPFAVVQLRKENAEGTMFNLVGFQTKLKYQEQDRVLRFIPALKDAVFLRYGSVHRNTYIQSPAVLNTALQFNGNGNIFFAGQITGAEGYVESTAMGLLAGIAAFLYSGGKQFTPPPGDTCIGGLLRYITTETKHFQPMNVNFGLLQDYKKREKEAAVERSLSSIEAWKKQMYEEMNQ